ncbi:MAG: ABC transporter permease subunit [Rhodobacteraceae bacterium]|nr:ABC transporter permease subunit [Paracoccaceae bacterium]
MIVLLLYAVLFVLAFVVVRFIRHRTVRHDLTSLKTVTFGDESAVVPDRAASVISVLSVFLIWGAFTGSHWVPLHVPGPYVGPVSFNYTMKDASGATAEGRVDVTVYPVGQEPKLPAPAPAAGFAPNIVADVAAWRTVLIRNKAPEGAQVVAIDGKPVTVDKPLRVAHGSVTLTSHGSFNFYPDAGMQMEPIWLPSPEAVVARFFNVAANGFQNVSLWDHVSASLMRVLVGFALGSVVGIPLGYAMGLSGWVRGWFDPIVEFMRPVPPLALIPLVIIWFGIWETGKIVLLFLAALWIMVIAARAGVSGVRISKIHAAYSLGASKWQILRHVIIPNSLPDLFTGARVAMGVCWGTVVAAELVAAQKGAGMMIIVASKFQLTDLVVMGIILIGIIGYGIDILMRMAERVLVPWKGRG